MKTTASIILFKNEFIATLSDGRHIERSDLRELAGALANAGVQANNVSFEWNGSSGQRMVTAGQQVALCAEMRRLTRQHPKNLAVAA